MRGGRSEITEGQPRSRTVVLEFPSYEAALGVLSFARVPGRQGAAPGKADADVVVIEGYDGK